VQLRVKQDGPKVAVEVEADAGSPGQPITGLELRLDGRPVQAEGDKPAAATFSPPRTRGARGSWTVTLEPGAHKLSVRAAAPDTYSISDEVAVEVVPPRPVPKNARRGTLHYVGIGVNQFQKHPDLTLQGAVPDVKNLQKCLKETCAARFLEVRCTVLTDQQATAAAVLKELKDLQGQLKPADVVIVHYSSHGEVDARGGLFLLAHDSDRDDLEKTAVSGHDLRTILGQYPSQVLLILDACHAGGFKIRPATDPLSRLLADDSCGVAVLSAALSHQKAEDRAQGGLFTQAIVKGLSGQAKPDEVTRRLYVHNLYTYVYSLVAGETDNRQMPLYLPSGSVPPIVLKEGSGN
jgi:hypothetical protein